MIRRVIPAIALLCAILWVLVTPSFAVAADQSDPQQSQTQQQSQSYQQKQYSQIAQSYPDQTPQQSQSQQKNQSLQDSAAHFFNEVANQFSGKQSAQAPPGQQEQSSPQTVPN